MEATAAVDLKTELDGKSVLIVTQEIRIPLSEIEIWFVRSSGPGGQHVNKTSTQVELEFDLANSPSIPERDRRWLLTRLGTKVGADGRIRIAAQEYRSQLRNKKEALEKLRIMLREALVRPKKRKATKPTKASRENRLKAKNIRSRVKSARLRRGSDED